MKNLDKKSNKDLIDLKQRLGNDFETLRKELIQKHDHWVVVKETYNEVYSELKKRNIL